ncbi:siderophore-interacting protein [Paenirhodobacter populi]|nr:siderophore-interacting protein [Sinirhodobacter populi]
MAESGEHTPETGSVEDPEGLLEREDHMQGMERIEMRVVRIDRPVPSVARVIGHIAPQDPAAWTPPNQAIRIAVAQPEGQRPVMRVYTVRRFDPATGLLEIDFILHGDDSPAMRWLHDAAPGTLLPMIGPRQHVVPLPVEGKRAAIFADETAIPAVWAILNAWAPEAWTQGLESDVWIETADPTAFDELPRPEGVNLHLLLRAEGEPAGATGHLAAAARTISDPGACVIWAAGERQEMRRIREHFRAAGVPRDQLQVVGYWKLGISGTELDRVRLAEYAALLAKGRTLADLSDDELPI